jgi:hypothetical protein
MSYLFQDLGDLALATLLAPLLLFLPALGLVRLLAKVGLITGSYWQRIGWAMILGLALLPALDSLMIRMLGMPGMLLLALPLACYGLPWLKSVNYRLSPLFVAMAAIWWIICAWSYVDVDSGGQLYRSLIAIDMVKHAAVIEQIAREGIPFSDPFFAREGIAGYYHYFYVWAAAIRWISGFGISAAMAFGATAFWTGFGAVALVWQIADDAAFIRPGRGRRMLILAVLLCFVAGADLLFMVLRYLIIHRIEPELDNWNTEIRMFGTSILWVPHHVMALIAAWAGMLLCVRAGARRGHERLCLALAAGAAFATLFGASIWIALTIAPCLAVWTVIALWRRDPSLMIAGITALILSVPQFHDIVHGRAPDIFPVAFGIRPFTILFSKDTIADQLFSLILLPLNYALEFGLCALGARLYWRTGQMPGEAGAAVRQLILWSAIISLLVSSFLQSVVINNDLGWRAILFAVLSAMLWTLRLGQSVRSMRKLPAMAAFLLVLGLAGTVWDLAGLRIIRAPLFPTRILQTDNNRPLNFDLRMAYGWADRHLPPGALLQHNPARAQRMLDFGLYGHHWPAVADEQANLFGASRPAVMARMALLKPVFDGPLAPAVLINRARRAHVDYLLFTSSDPAWRAHRGPPPGLFCPYRTARICIAPVAQGVRR